MYSFPKSRIKKHKQWAIIDWTWPTSYRHIHTLTHTHTHSQKRFLKTHFSSSKYFRTCFYGVIKQNRKFLILQSYEDAKIKKVSFALNFNALINVYLHLIYIIIKECVRVKSKECKIKKSGLHYPGVFSDDPNVRLCVIQPEIFGRESKNASSMGRGHQRRFALFPDWFNLIAASNFCQSQSCWWREPRVIAPTTTPQGWNPFCLFRLERALLTCRCCAAYPRSIVSPPCS